MYTLPELAYPFEALEPHIDSQTMQIHHGKHHAAYIKNLNDALSGQDDLLNMEITELIQNLDKVPEGLRQKVRNNGGGHANHTFFWKIMAPDAGGGPIGKILEALNSTFGDFNSFQEKFEAAGVGRFGSGWIWLVSDKGKLAIVDTPNQDTPLMEGTKAVLGLDVWEHAYYLKYQNRRLDYIKAWWNVVNWKKVEEYFAKTLK
ncbi:superoxide dismutase [Candidatus Woesebacteria bacterium]|nr:superoxide dismutase [Candidatus Woesebacteria bacterium]